MSETPTTEVLARIAYEDTALEIIKLTDFDALTITRRGTRLTVPLILVRALLNEHDRQASHKDS